MDNPCNPTGTVISIDKIKDFVLHVSELPNPPLVVIDEAYYEYVTDSGYSTSLEFIKQDYKDN